MKTCQTMDEVRTEIDRIDALLTPLLLERLGYIKQAGKIKSDRSQVRDNERVEDVINKVCEVANGLGGNEAYIADIYRFLIQWSIEHEFKVWDRQHSGLT